jgi:hypothetical protein
MMIWFDVPKFPTEIGNPDVARCPDKATYHKADYEPARERTSLIGGMARRHGLVPDDAADGSKRTCSWETITCHAQEIWLRK